MAPEKYGRNYIVETRDDPSRTAGGDGWVKDSCGQWWKVVNWCFCEGTATRCGVILSDGERQFIR